MVDVVKIFPTIQGEGPFQGAPSVFIRLAGCDLECPGCDTDYTTNRRKMWPPDIVAEVQQYMKGCLVVLTGGEPFRQNITPLCRLLLNSGYQVQIECNGTITPLSESVKDTKLAQQFPWSRVTICVSPKTSQIQNDFWRFAHYVKYILDAEHIDPSDGLPSASLGMNQRPARKPTGLVLPVYVQPFDSKDEEKTTANVTATVNSCMAFNYRVCLQIHKILGLE